MFPVVLVKVKLGIGRFANSYQACNTKLYFSIHTFNTLSVTVVNRVEGVYACDPCGIVMLTGDITQGS